MKAYDLVELAGRNLREAILRNSLTTLGIGVGVASLVAMLSLGVGLQRLATRQLGRSGLFDSIFVSPGGGFRNGGRARSVLVPATYKPLDDAARKTLEKIPFVVDVYPDIRVPSEFRFGVSGKPESAFFALMAGQPPSSRRSEAFDDLQGSFFSGPKVAETVILAEFGRELLDVPYDPKNADQKLTPEQASQLLGKELTLRYRERQSIQSPTGDSQPADSTNFSVLTREQKLKIVGIVATEPNGGTRGNARVLVPTDFADSLNMIMPGDLRAIIRPSEGKTYPSLVVRVTKSKDIAGIEAAIKKEGFSAFSIVDASKGIARFFTFLDLFLGIFGSLALAVASLGIVNTLVMAILERRREIGIMKAIGASDGDVKKLFFVEAGCMGALGGTLGVAMGWTIGKVINLGTNIYLQRQDLKPENFWYVPWWLVAAALAFSVVVSLIAGLYPAARAARLDPVEALRQN